MLENVLFVCNGPGEIHSLLRPLALAFRKALPQVRLSLVLTPSQFASGYEAKIAQDLGCLDEILPVTQFWEWVRKPKLLKEHFRGSGLVFAIAGELWHTRLINRALNWPQFAYLEVSQWGVGFRRVFQSKAENLMADLPQVSDSQFTQALASKRMGFYVGSRQLFMQRLVPFYEQVILKLKLADPEIKPVFWVPEHLQPEFKQKFPQAVLMQALEEVAMMVTIVGTNTAVLSAKQIPMLVWLPLNWPEVIPLGGIAQYLGLKRFVLSLALKFSNKPRALPNVLSGQNVVPELVSKLTPPQMAETILKHWNNPSSLQKMHERLKNILGRSGVADRMVAQVAQSLGAKWN